MKISTQRILTTHVGSIPRPAALRELLVRQDRGEAVDEAALARESEAAVRMVVARQLEVGVDVANDGEQPRAGFSTYVARRMRGFGGASRRLPSRDLRDFPDYAELLAHRRRDAARIVDAPQAVAEVRYEDLSEAARECDVFLEASRTARFTERFMTAVSPGTIATILLNAHYETHERYVLALAREMRREYELIHARGLVLQLDCPDLAMERARFFQDEPLERFLAAVELHVEAINQAIAAIPPERVRLHLCWGNYDGPHVHDVPLEAVWPIVLRARVGAISLPLANPRHQHEYTIIKRLRLPDGLLFLPGVIDTTTNYVEHPEVVAERLVRAVDAVGDRARVLASTDCGFGTFAGSEMCAPSVVWAKLRALRDGADLASRRLGAA
ncbi:MAG: cobalamin-independent methionine synthase II family protein [Candidatus Rokuibacteriota bacterium]|nr:MAG: cobalamin-independent methionine synthase II family protein [Candidatus Rokubacteria bacterium]